MVKTPETYVLRMIEISTKKYALLKEILDITTVQSEFISQDKMDFLKKNITEKQEKIDHIDRLDEEFNVYFQRLKQEMKIKRLDELNDRNINGIKDLQKLITCIIDVISKIAETEKSNNTRARKLLDDIGTHLKNLNQGKKVITAYKGGYNLVKPSYFIDKKK